MGKFWIISHSEFWIMQWSCVPVAWGESAPVELLVQAFGGSTTKVRRKNIRKWEKGFEEMWAKHWLLLSSDTQHVFPGLVSVQGLLSVCSTTIIEIQSTDLEIFLAIWQSKCMSFESNNFFLMASFYFIFLVIHFICTLWKNWSAMYCRKNNPSSSSWKHPVVVHIKQWSYY